MKTAIVLVLVAVAQSAKFPSNFHKCNRKDPDFDKCALEAANNGVVQVTKPFPEIHLPNLNPLEMSELKIGAGSEGVVNVQQNFKNCKLYGIDKIHFDTFRFDFEKKVLDASSFIPEIKKLCDYELNGKVLLLPIVGTGKSTIILRNIKLGGQYNFEEVQKKGKTFMNFKTFTFSFNPDFVSFDFENLFNGDKQLGDNINKVLNENYKEVFADVQKGYEEGFGLVIKNILNNLFAKVSMEEAFD
ncbi:protein takeout-like [Tribolium madens]|uniref:protein takeout-like n=1 Tax=Tribolium madens TaxID=41895 RepID=UPI001CF73E34|nr:protein takeout-like [Tribolium madens]